MALHNIGRKSVAAAAVIGLGALLVGCSNPNGSESAFARVQPSAGYGGAASAAPLPRGGPCGANPRARRAPGRGGGGGGGAGGRGAAPPPPPPGGGAGGGGARPPPPPPPAR